MARKRSGVNNDIQELEKSFNSLSGNHKNRSGKYAAKAKLPIPLLLSVLIVVVLIGVIITGIFAINSFRGNQAITANITVLGMDVTGMTREQAQAAITEKFQALYTDTDLTVTVDGETLVIPASVARPTLNTPKVVDAAIHYSVFHTDKKALDITKYITIDNAAVQTMISSFAQGFSAKLTQTTHVHSGTKPTFFDKIDENANLILHITKGQAGIRLDEALLIAEILQTYSNGGNQVEYACVVTEPDPLDWDTIAAYYNLPAKNAEMDPETFQITEGTYGYGVDLEVAKQMLDDAQYGETFELPFQWTAPEITAQQLSENLFKDVLATYTTKASSQWGRDVNLRLAAQACNGLILYPGDVFSFNGTLGERTIEKGYKAAASYINGQTVNDIGGGICQVATTIYYCAVISDLKIVERYPHIYASTYTPLSTDATVFWNGVDFKFQNNTDYPIRIDASTQNGNVTISLIGTDTKDYYVKFVHEWLSTIAYETVYEEMEADNEEGYKDGDVITTPYTGYTSRSYRVKYDKQTNQEISRTLECQDRYAPRNKVICKIIGLEEETTEPTPTDPPTEPPTDPPTTPPVTDPPTEPTTQAPTVLPTEVPTETPSADPGTTEG